MNNAQLKLAPLALAISAVLVLGACAAQTPADSSSESITIYSGRSEELIADLLTSFTAETGIPVEVRYGDSAELAAQILEEGDNVRADVYFSQDAGALGALAKAGVTKTLPDPGGAPGERNTQNCPVMQQCSNAWLLVRGTFTKTISLSSY